MFGLHVNAMDAAPAGLATSLAGGEIAAASSCWDSSVLTASASLCGYRSLSVNSARPRSGDAAQEALQRPAAFSQRSLSTRSLSPPRDVAHGGDGVREALSCNQSPLPRVPSYGMPPSFRRSATVPSLCSGETPPSARVLQGLQRSDSAQSVHDVRAGETPRSAPRSRRRSQGMSPNSSVHDLRARPCETDSKLAANYLNGVSAWVGTSLGPQAARDNLWREVFGGVGAEKSMPRLRGDGQAIGKRHQSSTGIPWRNIPEYGSDGSLVATGITHSECDSRAAWSVQLKTWTELSMEHSGNGVRDLLSPFCSRPAVRPALLYPVLSMAAAAAAAEKALGQQASEAGPPAPTRGDHWTYTPHVHLTKEHQSVKDHCPYTREGDVAVPLHPGRRALSPPSSFAGALLSPSGASPPTSCAERVRSARRDWQHAQDRANIHDGVTRPTASAATRLAVQVHAQSAQCEIRLTMPTGTPQKHVDSCVSTTDSSTSTVSIARNAPAMLTNASRSSFGGPHRPRWK